MRLIKKNDTVRNMTLESFYNWLNNYLNFEKTQQKNIFWLESMRFLCQKLNNPQDQIPCVHIAGSKGKGSTAIMTASILEESGVKCGIYSSPHISDFRERICTRNGFFSDRIYEESADELTSLVDSIPPEDFPGQRPLTWFELVTVFAFLCFKKAGVDFVVYETGLGGRLDSTNVVKPMLTILMPIELEHTEFLGDTIEKIAGEKAGIIKENVPAVISFQNYKEAENVFLETCRRTNSKAFFVKDCIIPDVKGYKNGKMEILLTSTGKTPEIPEKFDIKTSLSMPGFVQAQNAAAASLAVKLIKPEITAREISKGLEKAMIPGRFQINGNIIMDGAHTVRSIQNALSTMKAVFPQKNFRLLFACAGDKDIKDIIPLFKGIFKKIIFTKPMTVRNCNPQEMLWQAESNGIKAEIINSLESAFSSLKSETKDDDIILVTGSFYLVSEVMTLLNSNHSKTLYPEVKK